MSSWERMIKLRAILAATQFCHFCNNFTLQIDAVYNKPKMSFCMPCLLPLGPDETAIVEIVQEALHTDDVAKLETVDHNAVEHVRFTHTNKNFGCMTILHFAVSSVLRDITIPVSLHFLTLSVGVQKCRTLH